MLKPLYDMIIVKPDEPIERKGEIYLPPNAVKRPTSGTVIAVGHGRITPNGQLMPLIVKEGDRVRYDDYAGQIFEDDGVQYMHMREQAIIGIIVKE